MFNERLNYGILNISKVYIQNCNFGNEYIFVENFNNCVPNVWHGVVEQFGAVTQCCQQSDG